MPLLALASAIPHRTVLISADDALTPRSAPSAVGRCAKIHEASPRLPATCVVFGLVYALLSSSVSVPVFNGASYRDAMLKA